MLTVHYWSNFFEIDELRAGTQSSAVINHLKRHFARHGIPDIVITDNGPQFTSALFAEFSQQWMFNHVTASPHFPQSNGMAESTVKTAKTLIRTALASNTEPWLAILAHRNTPSEGMITVCSADKQKAYFLCQKNTQSLTYQQCNMTKRTSDRGSYAQRTPTTKELTTCQACRLEPKFLSSHMP